MEDIIKETKETRVKIDKIFGLCKTLKSGREISLSITSLELSKMWLGRVLKEMGNTNPYPESRNVQNEKIEPTTDTFTSEFNYSEFVSFSHIQKIKWLRAEIEKIENEISDINISIGNRIDSSFIACQNSFDKCIEAGMWLGMELGRINNEVKSEIK